MTTQDATDEVLEDVREWTSQGRMLTVSQRSRLANRRRYHARWVEKTKPGTAFGDRHRRQLAAVDAALGQTYYGRLVVR